MFGGRSSKGLEPPQALLEALQAGVFPDIDEAIPSGKNARPRRYSKYLYAKAVHTEAMKERDRLPDDSKLLT